MKISVLGTGNVGRTLGIKWAHAGHHVVFGTRNPEARAGSIGPGDGEFGIEYKSNQEAAAAGEVVLIAVPSGAVAPLASQIGPALDGKILIDATNDFSQEHTSKVTDLAAAAPNATIYRAFNSLGWELFETPQVAGVQVDLFYCGPDVAPQRTTIESLITEIGLRPIWLGGLEMTSTVDAVGKIWISLAIRQGRGRHLTLNMVKD